MSQPPDTIRMRLLPENVEVIMQHIGVNNEEYQATVMTQPSCQARGRTMHDALQSIRQVIAECPHFFRMNEAGPLTSQMSRCYCQNNDGNNMLRSLSVRVEEGRTYRNEAEGAVHLFGEPISVEMIQKKHEQVHELAKALLQRFVTELEALSEKYGFILTTHQCPGKLQVSAAHGELDSPHAMIIPEIRGQVGGKREVRYHVVIPPEDPPRGMPEGKDAWGTR